MFHRVGFIQVRLTADETCHTEFPPGSFRHPLADCSGEKDRLAVNLYKREPIMQMFLEMPKNCLLERC